MELIVFDLDGTLLNQQSQITDFTRDTLQQLSAKDIAYTLATGRTLDSAHPIIQAHNFTLPHIYSNGVLTWDPSAQQMALEYCLTIAEVHDILATTQVHHITPFVSAVGTDNQQMIFHPTIHSDAEKTLLATFKARLHTEVLPLEAMDDTVHVTNISMIGPGVTVDKLHQHVNDATHLIAYSGPALERNGLKWMDIHHRNANKGSALEKLKQKLGVSRMICFGDSDNDLSMFAVADESYAPDNAHPQIKAAATSVIGHHDLDGVAHFLRERFSL